MVTIYLLRHQPPTTWPWQGLYCSPGLGATGVFSHPMASTIPHLALQDPQIPSVVFTEPPLSRADPRHLRRGGSSGQTHVWGPGVACEHTDTQCNSTRDVRLENRAPGVWRAKSFSPRPPGLGHQSGPPLHVLCGCGQPEHSRVGHRLAGWVPGAMLPPQVRDRRPQLEATSVRLWHSAGDASHIRSVEGDGFQNLLPGTQAGSSPAALLGLGGSWQVREAN